MTKNIRTNKWLRASLAIVVLLGVLLCAFPALNTKADTEAHYLTLNYNGGTYDGDIETVGYYFVPGESVNLPYGFDTSPQPGQAIGGWCYNKECTGEVLNGSHTFDEEVTLYAKWVDGWTVTVDMGEGAAYNEAAKGAVEKGKEITLRIPSLKTNPLPNGKMFCGIYTGPNGTGDCLLEYDKIALGQNFDVYSGWDIDDLKYTPTKDTTLYAYWAEPITLTFDVNGGNDLGIYNYSAYKTIEETDTKVKVQALPPANTEATNAYLGDVRFIGWSTDKNATTPMDTSKLKESAYLYAVYPETWKVSVDMTEGAEYNQEYTCYAEKGYLVHVNIPELAKNPLPNGNSYAGVYTGKNGTGERVGRSSTLSFDYTPTKDTTLYVFWSKPIEVTFDANGGELLITYGYSEERGESYTINDYPGNIQDRHVFIGIREGYNFLGWSKNKNATQPDESLAGQQTSQWDIRESGTYYAVWQDENDVPAKYEYKVLDESKKTAMITGYEGKNKTLEIPKTIDGYTITKIDDLVFYARSLESVAIPDSVTYIGKDAFGRNRKLESVKLSSKLETIDDGAFANTGLKSVAIPNSVTKIGQGAFDSCTALEKVTLPVNLTTIEDGTFFNCKSLTDITIPSKVTKIGDSAFMECQSLKKLTIPNSVTSIEAGAFWCCDNLHELTIPASVKSIKPFAVGYISKEGTEEEYKARHIKIPEGTFTYEMRFAAGDGGPMVYYINQTDKTFVIKGYVDSAAEKYANDNKIKFVDLEGRLNGFVQGPDGKWAIYKNNKVDTSATGIFQNENGWWRVENGYVNFKANGIYQNEYGWWKTTNGKVTFKETGVFQNENGWWRVKDSKVDFKANGIYQNKNGWWKTTNGKVTFKETGVFQNENGWWRVKDSKVDFKANGIYQNQYGWWKTTNGKVTFKENGVFQNEHGWWVVKDSKVDFNANGFYKKGNEIWKFTDGKITFKENGTFAGNDGKTVYRVKDSKVDTKDTGVYPFGNDMLKFTDGICNYNENGIFKNKSGIWYLKDSKVDSDFTGFASNNDGTWYFESGKVNTKKTGTFLIEGDHFTLKNGELV